MSDTIELHAGLREDMGKGASRRLRHSGKMPAIIYGGGEKPQNLVLEHHKVVHATEDGRIFSQVLNLIIDGKKQAAVIKDVQRHPAERRILHMDFQRIRADQKIHVHVPLEFINGEKCPGVKESGGIVVHHMADVEITCLPGNLPEKIVVDLADLAIDKVVHLSDLVLPEGASIAVLAQGEDHDHPVAGITIPRAAVEEEEETSAEEAGEEGKGDEGAGDDTAGENGE